MPKLPTKKIRLRKLQDIDNSIDKVVTDVYDAADKKAITENEAKRIGKRIDDSREIVAKRQSRTIKEPEKRSKQKKPVKSKKSKPKKTKSKK